MITRMKTLCLKAATYLKDGGDPFDSSFLIENNVTLDEALTMSEIFCHAVREHFGVE
jgi:hypothetical protein